MSPPVCGTCGNIAALPVTCVLCSRDEAEVTAEKLIRLQTENAVLKRTVASVERRLALHECPGCGGDIVDWEIEPGQLASEPKYWHEDSDCEYGKKTS